MKLFKTLSLSFMLAFGVANSVNAGNPSVISLINNYPAKTICLKHPEAANSDKFFSTQTMLNFEIYKPTSEAEVAEIVKKFKANADVAGCDLGRVTGDFHSITLTLKQAKSKSWFIAQFKKVGLTNIKINNNEVVSVDKM